MVNASTLASLKKFFNEPCELTASNLVLIPALHQVIEHEMSQKSTVSTATIGVCRWLFTRAYTVFKGQSKYGPPADVTMEHGTTSKAMSWKEVRPSKEVPTESVLIAQIH